MKKDAKKRPFSGAADRTWTGTVVKPRDFKSLASAYSTTAAFIKMQELKNIKSENDERINARILKQKLWLHSSLDTIDCVFWSEISFSQGIKSQMRQIDDVFLENCWFFARSGSDFELRKALNYSIRHNIWYRSYRKAPKGTKTYLHFKSVASAYSATVA